MGHGRGLTRAVGRARAQLMFDSLEPAHANTAVVLLHHSVKETMCIGQKKFCCIDPTPSLP